MNEIGVWGQCADLGALGELIASADDLQRYCEETIGSENADDACDVLWHLLWSTRRMLWRDLIPAARLTVRFLHSHESGYGVGPITAIRTSAGQDSELVFSTEYFQNSDTMHMEYGSGPGLFGWPGFPLTYLSFEEHDNSDLYEHSFDAEARVDVDQEEGSATWNELDARTQTQVVNAVLAGHAIQMEEFEEVVVSGTDVLAMIAVHPGTSRETLTLGESAAGSAFAEALALR